MKPEEMKEAFESAVRFIAMFAQEMGAEKCIITVKNGQPSVTFETDNEKGLKL